MIVWTTIVLVGLFLVYLVYRLVKWYWEEIDPGTYVIERAKLGDRYYKRISHKSKLRAWIRHRQKKLFKTHAPLKLQRSHNDDEVHLS